VNADDKGLHGAGLPGEVSWRRWRGRVREGIVAVGVRGPHLSREEAAGQVDFGGRAVAEDVEGGRARTPPVDAALRANT
jgi:hypothetical protein